MNTWVQVDKLQDEDPVNAETLNRPVDQLASRTDYLKRRLGSIMDNGIPSCLILPNVTLMSEETDPLVVGNVVYRSSKGFCKAQAKMHLYDDYTADHSSFTLGILVKSYGDTGDVLIYGKLDLVNEYRIAIENVVQTGETFRSGRYYLSATEAGKLTAHPNGPLVYVGTFQADASTGTFFSGDSVAYINPQFLDMGTSHVHRAYRLTARPAGNLEGSTVIGYLPDGIAESSTSTGSSSDSGSDEETQYPSLIFGGTWTSTSDVVYTFSLSGNAWGNIKLNYWKNGNAARYKTVSIQAPNVFVDLDNGLKVKVRFPGATNTKAYEGIDESELVWNLTFPDAGKGWVNHAVDAIASKIEDTVSSDSTDDDAVTPKLKACLSGSWPSNDNAVYGLFPTTLYKKTLTLSDLDNTLTINGVVYDFVSDDSSDSPIEGAVEVRKATTVNESLHNLALLANDSAAEAHVLVKDNTLIVCDQTLLNPDSTITGEAFTVIGGTIKALVIYDANYYVVGDVIANKPTYVPITLDNLSFVLYAQDATLNPSFTCTLGTRLIATAYDYDPKAVYDYVMGLHQEVDYYFPPVPAQAAGLFVNGVEMDSAALFKDNPTYKIGQKTLYWMEDDTDRQPWPSGITGHDDIVSPENDKNMVFYFVVGFQCATGPVTSLVPAPGSSVKLYTYGTNDTAYTGDLMIDAALDVSVDDAGVQGYNVAKQGKNGRLLGGAVVERIKAGPGISVTQAAGCPTGQGTVTVSLEDGSLRGNFNEIALENAKQEKIGLFPYVSLLGWGSSDNIPSAFTIMMRVPSNLNADSDYQLQLRMVVFGTTGYEQSRMRAAGLELEYNILPDYTDTTNASLKTGLLKPDATRTITLPFGHSSGTSYKYNAFDPFVATTDASMEKSADRCVALSSLPIPSATEFSTTTPTLKPGYLVAVRISRTALADTTSYSAYTSPIGFLSMEWTLEEI